MRRKRNFQLSDQELSSALLDSYRGLRLDNCMFVGGMRL